MTKGSKQACIACNGRGYLKVERWRAMCWDCSGDGVQNDLRMLAAEERDERDDVGEDAGG